MEKLRTMIVEATIILLGVLIVVFFGALIRQQEVAERTQRMLEHENSQLELKVKDHDDMFGKYVDSISDAMLRDFYPEAKDLDYLRAYLKERYEIKQRKDHDGLCY